MSEPSRPAWASARTPIPVTTVAAPTKASLGSLLAAQDVDQDGGGRYVCDVGGDDDDMLIGRMPSYEAYRLGVAPQ